MLNNIPNNKREQLQPLIEHLLNKTHKCFQSCIPHSSNIIYYTHTHTFIEGEPVVTVIIQCPKCKQLTYLLYTLNNCNTPIYRENLISIPFIRIFLRNYSPYTLKMSSQLYSYLASTLNNYYLNIQIRKNKRAKYVNILDIFDYCFENTLLLQPVLFLKHFMLRDNIEKSKQIIISILSLSKKQIHEIFSLSKKQVHEVDKITKEKQLAYHVH